MKRKTVVLIILFLVISNYSYSMSMSDTPTFDGLVRKSTDIVLAKLVGTKSFIKNNAVYTNYDFIVLTNIKGTLQKNGHFNLTMYGGLHGKRFSMRPGVTTFKNNAKAILFLTSTDEKVVLTSAGFGQFPIMKNKESFYDPTRKNNYSLKEIIESILKIGKQ